MEQAVAALKAAMSNNPTVDVPELNHNDDIFDYYNPKDCLHYRKEKVLLSGDEHSVRRVYYYKAGESSSYRNVGWVLDSDCDACLKCNQKFGIFKTKHHCRVCGDLVCNSCSEGRVVITEFRDSGPVRACNQCNFGQAEVSVRKEEHVMDILHRAEEYTLARRNQVENEVVETATWQADFQEVERVAREKAAECARVAAETAALRASMMSAANGASSVSSPNAPGAYEECDDDDNNSGVPVFLSLDPPVLIVPTSHHGTICNHERNVMRDLLIIERQAMKDSSKFLSEAEAAAVMQRELADKVRKLEGVVAACEVAVVNATHLREDAEARDQSTMKNEGERKQDCDDIDVGKNTKGEHHEESASKEEDGLEENELTLGHTGGASESKGENL